jgi:CRISPR-associated protein Csd1
MTVFLRVLRDRGTAEVPGYQERAIRALVELDEQGCLIGFTENADGTAKRGRKLPIPSLKRTVAPRPILFADGPDYLFGIPDDPSGAERAATRQALHLQLARRCAEETRSPAAEAAVRFLVAATEKGALAERLRALVTQYPGDLCLKVRDRLVTDDVRVQQFWAQVMGLAAGAAAGPGVTTRCAVCGEWAAIPEMWPVPIKGIPGGQSSGTQLVSMNSDAFESYGLARAAGAMTCGPCGERIGNALNSLLADPRHRLIIGPVVYLAWHDGDQEFDLFSILQDPQPELVQALLRSPLTAHSEHLQASTGLLMTVALTANASRVVVRQWSQVAVPDARQRLKEYFERQAVIGPWGEPPQPVKLAALAGASVRDFRDLPPGTVTSLLHGILNSRPLPPRLAWLTLRRITVQDPPKVTHPQAALLTWFLRQSQKEMPVPTSLDPTVDNPAYLCGRALAEIDAIQRSALGKVNATVVDRYFGATSSRPATVLGMLVRNAQDHLKKLRGSNEAAAIAHDRRLGEVLDRLSAVPIPATLSLTDQTLFCLGFYHQRAEARRAVQERRDRANVPAGATDDHLAEAQEDDA